MYILYDKKKKEIYYVANTYNKCEEFKIKNYDYKYYDWDIQIEKVDTFLKNNIINNFVLIKKIEITNLKNIKKIKETYF